MLASSHSKTTYTELLFVARDIKMNKNKYILGKLIITKPFQDNKTNMLPVDFLEPLKLVS